MSRVQAPSQSLLETRTFYTFCTINFSSTSFKFFMYSDLPWCGELIVNSIGCFEWYYLFGIKLFLYVKRPKSPKLYSEMGGKVSSEGGELKDQAQTNVGLVNIASENLGGLNALEVLEIISFIILTFLVVRWLRKWCKGRKAQKMEGLKCMMKDASAMEMGRLTSKSAPSAPPAIMGNAPQVMALPPPSLQLGSQIMQNYQA